jgi:hypothetical protein
MQASWGSPKLAALRYVIPREMSSKIDGHSGALAWRAESLIFLGGESFVHIRIPIRRLALA